MGELGTAVVGTGFIGPVHVEALRRLGVPVRGVVGSTAERGTQAAAALGLPRAYPTLAEALADPAVRIVHLTSPNRHHYAQVKEVLAAGRHVVCEKPLGVSAQETAELVRLADATPVVAAVCYNVRFYPQCLEARQLRAGGRLGPVHHIVGSYLQDWLLDETDFNWRVVAAEAGPLRAVADIGTHWLDLITFITGLELEAVCADLHTVWPTRQRPTGPVETFTKAAGQTVPVAIDTEDYGSLLLRFKGGARGVVTVSQVSAGRKNCLRFDLACGQASLAWNSEQPEELWVGRRHESSELRLRDPAKLDPAVRPYTNYPGGHAEGFPDTFKQMFRAVYADIAAVEAGRKPAGPPLYATFADGHREALYCDAILASHRTGGWVVVG